VSPSLSFLLTLLLKRPVDIHHARIEAATSLPSCMGSCMLKFVLKISSMRERFMQPDFSCFCVYRLWVCRVFERRQFKLANPYLPSLHKTVIALLMFAFLSTLDVGCAPARGLRVCWLWLLLEACGCREKPAANAHHGSVVTHGNFLPYL